MLLKLIYNRQTRRAVFLALFLVGFYSLSLLFSGPGLAVKEPGDPTTKSKSRFNATHRSYTPKRPVSVKTQSAAKGADSRQLDRIRAHTSRCIKSYTKFAWGDDELKPVTNVGRNWTQVSYLFTPVDSLDTLWIMGLEKEYGIFKELVLDQLPINMNLPNSKSHNHFELVIRVLGGLLSAYTLDSDPRLLDLAIKVGDRLLLAFNHPSSLPPQGFFFQTGEAVGESTCLAAMGTLQLEFQYLTDLTGDRKYQEKALRIYGILKKLNTGKDAIPGLYPSRVSLTDNPVTFINQWSFRIGYDVDSFYEYLLKMYISTREEEFGKLYDLSRDAILSTLKTVRNTSVFLPDFTSSTNTKLDRFEHLACFSGGMLALGAVSRSKLSSLEKIVKSDPNFKVGQQITETCQRSYSDSSTGLGGDIFTIIEEGNVYLSDTSVYLRPEVIESVFYQWRFTKNQKYRDFGVKMLDSLEKYSKTDSCFSALQATEKTDNLESFFFAETLKYLYLLFSDDSVISLEEYVFNTEAHPFSVRGHGRRKDPRDWVKIDTSLLS